MRCFRVRTALFGLIGALALFAAAPVASMATTSPSIPTLVPKQVDTRVIQHPCRDNSGVQTCKLIVVTTVPAHYVLSDSVPAALTALVVPAHACWGYYYLWPSMTATDYTGWGTVATQITLSAENWYNGCSAGAVWVDFTCSSTPGWSCLSASHGGFWDSGNGYYQDWGNQETSNVFNATIWWYLRMHIYPNGSWARWCYNTGSGSC